MSEVEPGAAHQPTEQPAEQPGGQPAEPMPGPFAWLVALGIVGLFAVIIIWFAVLLAQWMWAGLHGDGEEFVCKKTDYAEVAEGYDPCASYRMTQ